MYGADEDQRIYAVVVNDEEQYSIWPEPGEPPLGWRKAGRSGSRAECLDHIEQVWTDMRPLSLRRHMDGTDGQDRPEEART
ncbi:MbtH family protein [Streptomyces sp. URMC 127]|uniref:MbtH family protein n=1 Tax=Streptomyces sp. URMC 127 TaxID=3423402 RepID=UPI003F1AFCBB